MNLSEDLHGYFQKIYIPQLKSQKNLTSLFQTKRA